jgi:tRNA modification GTPase
METITAKRLTPHGKGGVAVVRLCGDGAEDVFRQHYRGRLEDNRPNFGRLQLPNGQCEEVVVHRVSSCEIEIHSHGGILVVETIEALFNANVSDRASARAVPATVLAGSQARAMPATVPAGANVPAGAKARPLTMAETAWQLLPFAPTERIAKILLEVYNGTMQLSPETLQRLVTPFRVVLAGAPNAGKSSLINAILGFQRSMVEPTAGTTRDVVTAQTAIDGIAFIFHDTAGLRTGSDDIIESEGIRRAYQAAEEADIVVWVMDATAPALPDFSRMPESLLLCYNKTDLYRPVIKPQAVAVSAKTGAGIGELCTAVAEQAARDSGIVAHKGTNFTKK